MKRALLLVICAAAAGMAASGAQEALRAFPRPILIIGGTVIDGSGAAPHHNDGILLQNGRIRLVGKRALDRAPADARHIDATDKWILPGLIDGHVHFFMDGGIDARPEVIIKPGSRAYAKMTSEIRRAPQVYLRAYICSGITSVVVPGGAPWEFQLRASREDDPLAPRMAFSGPLLMAIARPPAVEPGDDAPMRIMKDADQTRALVRTIAAEKPDFIKIFFEPAAGVDSAQTTLLRAAIDAAHLAGLRAFVHAPTLETARTAVDAGADALMHSVGDRPADDGFVRAVVTRKVIYVPTLIVGRSYRDVRLRQVVFEPFERDCAPPATIASFDALPTLSESVLPRPAPSPPDALPVEEQNLKRLADAGAVIAAGSDAGNARTLHGPSLHREFVLMAEAGLTPMQILVSATANGAKLMGREKELGQIREGMLADVVILEADPLADIRNTRRIFRVIRGGAVYER